MPGNDESTGGLIFVVEDDEDIRAMLQQVLQFRGYQVALASNGREALEKLQNGLRPRLVIFDLMMPEMDGLEFRARQMEMFPGIPGIVMSGSRNLEFKTQDLQVEVLEKPVGLPTLFRAIEHARC